MNLGISNVHYNVDEKQGPLYIALRTGHIYIYMPCAQGIYIIYALYGGLYTTIQPSKGGYMWILQEPYSSGVLVKNEYPVYRVCKWDIYIYIYIAAH